MNDKEKLKERIFKNIKIKDVVKGIDKRVEEALKGLEQANKGKYAEISHRPNS